MKVCISGRLQTNKQKTKSYKNLKKDRKVVHLMENGKMKARCVSLANIWFVFVILLRSCSAHSG